MKGMKYTSSSGNLVSWKLFKFQGTILKNTSKGFPLICNFVVIDCCFIEIHILFQPSKARIGPVVPLYLLAMSLHPLFEECSEREGFKQCWSRVRRLMGNFSSLKKIVSYNTQDRAQDALTVLL